MAARPGSAGQGNVLMVLGSRLVWCSLEKGTPSVQGFPGALESWSHRSGAGALVLGKPGANPGLLTRGSQGGKLPRTIRPSIR